MDKVKHIMSKKVITVKREESVFAISQVFAKHNISCVIVVNDKKQPIGIITERDMVKSVVSKAIDTKKTTAEQIMSAPILTVTPEHTLLDAGRYMQSNNIRKCAVMDEGNLVGLITQTDVIRGSLVLIKHLNWKFIQGNISLKEYARILKEYIEQDK